MTVDRIRWLPALALLLFFALPSVARDGASAPAEEPRSAAEEAAAMIEAIKTEYASLEEMRAAPEGETLEDRAIRLQQILDEEVRVGALVHELAEFVVDAEQAADVGPARDQLVQWLKTLPEDVAAVIERRQGVLTDALKAREEAGPEDLAEAEERVTEAAEAVDDALIYYAEQLSLMAQLGIDTAALREDLIARLTERAEDVAARITVTDQARDQVSKVLGASPDDADAKLRALQLDERLNASVESLRRLAEELRGLDVDTADYQKLLVQVTGDVSDVGLNTSVITSLLEDWFADGRDWVVRSGPRLLGKLVVVVLILFFAGLLARLARRLVDRAFRFRQTGASTLLQRTASKLAGQLIFLLGVLVALSQLGVNIGPMLAGLGIAGFVVAFALQDTLSNFASGAFILFYRPFDVGDIVEAGGVTGKVLNMTLVTTTILTFDNQTLIVPNKKIWGDVIRNVTTQLTRRVDLVFGISYEDDVVHAERVLHEIIESDERILDDPAPTIRLNELGESSVNFIVRPWVKRDDYWDVYWDLTRTVKLRFDEEGISIPYPQRDVHHHYPERREAAPTAQGSAPVPEEQHAPEKGRGEGVESDSESPQN